MHSYSFHLSRSKDAIRTNEQDKNHDQIGGDLVKTCAQEAREVALIARGQYFSQSDDDAAYYCSAQRIYTSQDDGGKGNERGAAERRVNGDRLGGKKDAADGGDSSRNAPGKRVDGADVDAHGERC